MFSTNNAQKYLVTTFFYPPIKRRNTILLPPLLRKEIVNAKPSKKSHILVYQTSKTDRNIIPALKKVKENFIIYGLNGNKKEGNLVFKEFNETDFFYDLASCKAVIMNGSFTLMSEAIYLGKPVLSVPVRRQFEQIVNAKYLERLGFGKYEEHITQEKVEMFLSNLAKHEKALRDQKQVGNQLAISVIEGYLKKK